MNKRQTLTDKMTDLLDIEPNKPEEAKQEIVEFVSQPTEIIDTTAETVLTKEQQEVKDDFDLARKTLRKIVKTAENGLDGIEDLASTSDHPRAYEAMAALIKSASDTTKDLLELHKMKNILNPLDNQKVNTGQAINVEKAVFVGSSVEMIRKIKETINENR